MVEPATQCLEAEQALLGAIFINNEAYYRVSSFLLPEDFCEPVHRDIFAACSVLTRQGRVAAPVTIAPSLPAQLTSDMSMIAYLGRLATEATTVLNAEDFGRVIKDASLRRALIGIGETLKTSALVPGRNATDLCEEAEQSLFALSESRDGRSRMRSFSETLTEAVQQAAAAYSRDGAMSGISTGLLDLDRLMGGLQKSDLIIIAARPAMGKTSLATNIAFHAASTFMGEAAADGTVVPRQGGRVAFFSLEMSGEQLAARILAEQVGIPSSIMRRGEITERNFEAVARMAQRLGTIPITVEDTGGLNIGQLVSAARRLKRQKGLDLIVVDYIQLLSGTTRRSDENRVHEITEITTKLKALAKELDVPVIALSQLSRQVEAREDKRPQLADLRDSGSIEQDADVVLFIYREAYYLATHEPKEGTAKHMEWQAEMEKAQGKADLILAKQRHGPTGTVPVAFDANLTRFSNLARAEYLPERYGERRDG